MNTQSVNVNKNPSLIPITIKPHPPKPYKIKPPPPKPYSIKNVAPTHDTPGQHTVHQIYIPPKPTQYAIMFTDDDIKKNMQNGIDNDMSAVERNTTFLLTADGRCGPKYNNQRCDNNKCCSADGQCGGQRLVDDNTAYCNASKHGNINIMAKNGQGLYDGWNYAHNAVPTNNDIEQLDKSANHRVLAYIDNDTYHQKLIGYDIQRSRNDTREHMPIEITNLLNGIDNILTPADRLKYFPISTDGLCGIGYGSKQCPLNQCCSALRTCGGQLKVDKNTLYCNSTGDGTFNLMTKNGKGLFDGWN